MILVSKEGLHVWSKREEEEEEEEEKKERSQAKRYGFYDFWYGTMNFWNGILKLCECPCNCMVRSLP